MISKNLYFNIITQNIAYHNSLCYFWGISFLLNDQYVCQSYASIMIVILTINLISYLNTTNRNIKFFFDSVRNDDSNLSFLGKKRRYRSE